jgi:glycosyltransferase involved in cell wall biosynthesis
MNITIESHLLNHGRRSGLLTYTEGLINGMVKYDTENMYSLIYYSLTRDTARMPGPNTDNFKKHVLKVPAQDFMWRQSWIDHVTLPVFLKANKVNIFHRLSGYTMPETKGVYKILTIHDLRSMTIDDQVWSQNINKYVKTVSDVDLCVVVSECTKRDAIEYLKVDENKVRVVYLGADERFRRIDPSEVQTVRAKYNINEPFLLSIGSVPRKNIGGIIRAFAGSNVRKKFLLVLSCNLDVAKYKALARELRVDHRVVILDKLADDEVVALYNSCHCFVFPSLYEGFGLPILEAMQCGAPVITSNLSSCPEVAGNAAILVNPNTVQEIRSAINEVCGNESLRQDLITKGYEQAKKFSWDNFAQDMKKIYLAAK